MFRDFSEKQWKSDPFPIRYIPYLKYVIILPPPHRFLLHCRLYSSIDRPRLLVKYRIKFVHRGQSYFKVAYDHY